jgi:SAM-dependent methyltransferase
MTPTGVRRVSWSDTSETARREPLCSGPLPRPTSNSRRDPTSFLARERQNWEELANLDPLWAILSFRNRKFGRWDNDAFFAEGDRDVQHLIERFQQLGYPQGAGAVLDFGCGVGRLAPGLSSYFDTYTGVDLSAEMVSRATELHGSRSNCQFLTNDDATLSQLADHSFDLVFSLRVLQHTTERPVIHSYLRSFVRLLRPGGLLIVQLPEHIPWGEKLIYDTRRRFYLALDRLRVSERLMFRRLGLHPMTMNFVRADAVTATLEGEGATLLSVDAGKQGIAIRDHTYYATLAS